MGLTSGINGLNPEQRKATSGGDSVDAVCPPVFLPKNDQWAPQWSNDLVPLREKKTSNSERLFPCFSLEDLSVVLIMAGAWWSWFVGVGLCFLHQNGERTEEDGQRTEEEATQTGDLSDANMFLVCLSDTG